MVQQLRIDVNNNIAACYLKMKVPNKAKEYCKHVLDLEPDNVKGLLRSAEAALALNDLDHAKTCISKLSKESKESKRGKMIIKRYRKQMNEHKEAMKAKFRKGF